MDSLHDPEFSRNFGFWSEREQQAILDSRVALAGVGGDGYLLGLSLLRMGVLEMAVADPEVFERENVNRVPGATSSRIGRNKADCFLDDAGEINPHARVSTFTDGVTPGNLEEFVRGADLVIDETELTALEIGTMISDEARRQGIPVLIVMNIGFAAQAFSFRPNDGPAFRDMMDIDHDLPLEDVALIPLDLSRCVAYLPSYLDASVLEDLSTGLSIPSIVQGVNAAAGIGTSEAFLHLVAALPGSLRPDPVWFPQVRYLDSLTGESGVVDDVPEAYERCMSALVENTRAGRVTPLDYARFA